MHSTSASISFNLVIDINPMHIMDRYSCFSFGFGLQVTRRAARADDHIDASSVYLSIRRCIDAFPILCYDGEIRDHASTLFGPADRDDLYSMRS
jgi:hypothetical protein